MIEYSVIIAVVIAALVTMQVYVKRGFQGKLRLAADSIGEQYAPKHTTTTGSFTLKMSGTTTTKSELEKGFSIPVGAGKFEKADVMRTTVTIAGADPEKTERTGGETVEALSDNLWE